MWLSFKTTFIRFGSSLLVCPYHYTIRLPLFSRSRGITYYHTWRQLIISMDTTGLYPLRRFWMMDRSSLLASRMIILWILMDLKLWLKFLTEWMNEFNGFEGFFHLLIYNFNLPWLSLLDIIELIHIHENYCWLADWLSDYLNITRQQKEGML
jgi:hypothetical protein